jgi:protoporphyrinogen oxidase
MGLAAAYEALLAGHAVTVYEAAPEPGGMAAHFMLGDISTERFYHFICKTDEPTFELLDELALADRLRWVPTSMGYLIDGSLHRWGDPVALLRFPRLSLVQKIRYALLVFISARRNRWDGLEHRNAREWITSWCGTAVYDLMWRKLFEQKFYEHADNVSAAWIWTRIRRIGRSRRSIMQEELGYIEGGSETLVRALVEAIRARGGEVRLATPATQVLTENGCVTGVLANGKPEPAEAVICTVPTPLIPRLVPNLGQPALAAYRAIVNIGVVCVVLRLRRSVTPHFWVNINEPDIEIPGIIEFSNLRRVADHVVYVPYYMPATHPKWSWVDAQFIDDAMACLMRVNPALRQGDLITFHVARLNHAQPICPPGFAARLPQVQTEIGGLQIADTCFYYPEDRGVAESIRLGRAMAKSI